MRRALVVLVLVAALGVPGTAAAETVTLRDREGRPITFDVQAAGTSARWYGDVLRQAAHGDEIASVTIRIVGSGRLAATCGREAGGCYRRQGRRGLIVVPAGRDTLTAHTILHEYAHHLDWARRVRGVRELNGTPGWWEARGMARLLEERAVAFDYSRGWTRAIGEIFAEDYVQLHLRSGWRIDWLAPPDDRVRAALRRDLENAPETPIALPPLVIVRNGTLGPGRTHSLPFGLLGPGRRVTATARLGGGGSGRLELRCDGRTVTTSAVTVGKPVMIDRRELGPAVCRVTLTSTSTGARRFTIRLRLAVESPAAGAGVTEP